MTLSYRVRCIQERWECIEPIYSWITIHALLDEHPVSLPSKRARMVESNERTAAAVIAVGGLIVAAVRFLE